MARRGSRPITETQAVEKVLGRLHAHRTDNPARMNPHEGLARLRLEVDEMSDGMRGIENSDPPREIAIRIAALAIRYATECT